MEPLTRRTIEQYLPILKAIYASLEVSLGREKDPDTRNMLRVTYLEKEFGFSRLGHAMLVLHAWLEGTQFMVENVLFISKKKKNAKWHEFFNLLDEKIMEYENGAPVIEVSIFLNGRVVRKVGNQELVHDFGSDGFKKEIIFHLTKKQDFVQRKDIHETVGTKSEESTIKTIAAINKTLRIKLQLPQQQKFIDGRQGSGYRINPIYNVILLH